MRKTKVKFSPRRHKLAYGLLFFSILATCLFLISFSSHKVYASGWLKSNTGYFYGGTIGVEGDDVLPGGLNGGNGNTCNDSSGNNKVADVSKFVTFITNGLNSSNNNRQMASAFIIIYMIKEDGGAGNITHPIEYAQSLLSTDSSTTGWGVSWLNAHYNYNSCDNTNNHASLFNNFSSSSTCDNTLYQEPGDIVGGSSGRGSNGDIESFGESCDNFSGLAIASFTRIGDASHVFMIKFLCGNPVGLPSGSGITSPTWILKGDSEVDKTTLGPGETAAFNHRVLNTGPDNATKYWWYVQGCHFTASQGESHCTGSDVGSNYSANNCSDINQGANPCGLQSNGSSSSPMTCSDGDYCPAYDSGNASEQYIFPSGTSDGDGYCERINFTVATGPGSNNGQSSPACVTYTSGVSGSFTCTNANFNVGDAHPGKSTILYAVYETPTGASPTASGNQNTNPGSWSSDPTLSRTGNWPDVTYGSLYSTPGNKPVSAKSNQSYTLSPSQYRSGNVTWYIVTYNLGSKSGNTYTLYVNSYSTHAVNGCFQATCTVNASGSFGASYPDDTEANHPFSYTVTVSNSGSNDLTDPLTGYGYSLEAVPSYASSSSPTSASIGTLDVGSPSSSPMTFNVPNAPNDTNQHPLTVYIKYPGTGINDAGSCSVNIDDYAQFAYSFNPTASLTPTSEDPTSVQKTYTYSITDNGSGENLGIDTPNNLLVNGQLNYVPPGGSPPGTVVENDTKIESHATENPTSTWTYSPTYTVTNPSAGDMYCISMNLSPYQGFVGPIGNYLNPAGLQNYKTEPPSGTSDCQTVHNEPYAQFFGNDVVGDSAFNSSHGASSTTCGAGGDNSGIYTYSHAASAGSGPSQGSYSQFGAQALSAIEGLGSAGLRPSGSLLVPSSSPPTGALGLSFSNTTNTTGGATDAKNLGGDFGSSLCASPASNNYFNEELPGPSAYSPGLSISAGDYTAGTGPGSTTTIGNTSPGGTINIPNGQKTAIFVTGNAYIDSNIVYSGASSWSSFSEIPSLWIIASGNIYIDPSVTQLDGVFVAQPNTNANTGVIDTCSNGTNPYNLEYLYGDGNYTYTDSSGTHTVSLPGCNNQLTVNGAFIDQATELDRSFSSVRYSHAGEYPQDSATHTCGTAGKDINGNNYTSSSQFSTCAAEVFNFSPEIYLSQPALKPNPGKYDYITSLSPVL